MFTRENGSPRKNPVFVRLTDDAKANLETACTEFQRSVAEVIGELLGDIRAVRAVLTGDGLTVDQVARVAGAVDKATRKRSSKRATTWAQKIGKAKAKRAKGGR